MSKNDNKSFIQVAIDDKGIRNEINKNIETPFDAFNEYIWNALDANARNIDIEFLKENNDIKKIIIKDDGNGIDYYKLKDELFGKFNVSPKPGMKGENVSLPRGHNGFGRFSFFKFASKVKWVTVFQKDNKNKYEYEIGMDSSNLAFSPFTGIKKSNKPVGTTVIFSFENMNLTNNCAKLLSDDKKDKLKELKLNLSLDLSWIIELFNLSFKLDGKQLDYEELIEERDESIELNIEEHKFKIKFIKWKRLLKNQYSRYYFLNSKKEEVYNNTTTLNNKGDEFYHSIYVESKYFDSFHFLKTKAEEVYNKLSKEIEEILAKKKKPYLQIFVNHKVQKLEKEKVFPQFTPFEDKFKKPLFKKALKKVIAFEPKLFTNKINTAQTKVFLELLNKLLDDGKSRDALCDILSVLVNDVNADHLEELKRQLENYGLENILGTIKEIENRLGTINYLKKIFNDNFKDYSEKDIQKIIEKNYWLFGEEYNLMVGSEKDDFNKLHRIYCEKVLKLKPKQYENKNYSKRKVDLFLCSVTFEGKRKKHLIVEIKKPALSLTKEHYRQIEDYQDEISKIPEFNTKEIHSWNYILLYRNISKEHANHFRARIKDKFTGETIGSTDFFKIFVIKWADLLEECEFRMKYLQNRLESRKKELLNIENEKELEKSPLKPYL